MDIRIGGSAPVGVREPNTPPAASERIEARVLAIRPARGSKRRPRGKGERRQNPDSVDPPRGKVLVLLVPEGHRLPAGVEKGDYRIFLHLVRR